MTQREAVLTMLEQAGSEGVTNGQFVGVQILRYSARIKELRDAGHRIEKHRVTDGTFRYTLHPPNQVPTGGDTLDGPGTGSRGSSSPGLHRSAPTGNPAHAAATSGRSVRPQGGGNQSHSSVPAAAALPTLFELPSRRYEDVA